MGHWDNDNVSVSGLICNKSKQAPSKIVQNQFNLTTKVKHLNHKVNLFLGSFKGVSISFKGVSMMSEGMVKIISKKFKGCFKKVLKFFDLFSRVIIAHFKGVLRQF